MTRHKKKRRVVGFGPDKFFNDDQVKQVLQYVRKEADAGGFRAAVNLNIVETLLVTAARASELVALKMCDLPMTHGKDSVLIRRGKGNVQRTLDNLGPEFVGRVAEFVRVHRRGVRPGSPLFVNESKEGGPMSYHSLYQKLKLIGIKSGIGRCTPHMFRHTSLGRLYRATTDLILVRDFAGHASTKTTEIYVHMFDPHRREKVRAVMSGYYANL